MKKNIECNSNGSNNVECNCDRYCYSRSNSYSSDSSRKILNRDRKRNNHYHGTTPGNNSKNLVTVPLTIVRVALFILR